MNLVLRGIQPKFAWETPFNRPYSRATGYWLAAVTLVFLTHASLVISTVMVEFLLITPFAIFLLAEITRQLRRYANHFTLLAAPDLEFSRRGLLALHVMRTLLIVAELTASLGMAALVAAFVDL